MKKTVWGIVPKAVFFVLFRHFTQFASLDNYFSEFFIKFAEKRSKHILHPPTAEVLT